MSTFEVIVGFPTFGTSQFSSLIHAFGDHAADGRVPILVVADDRTGFSLIEPNRSPFPHPSGLAVRFVVEAADPLNATTDLVARIAIVMRALGFAGNYPSVLDVTPLLGWDS